jgi:Ca2+-binding EF-hand superfamily protein
MSNMATVLYGSYGLRSALGASAPSLPTRELSKVFSQIDTDGREMISRGQFIRAFETMNPSAGFRQLGAEGVFAALNAQGTGQVSEFSFIQGMTRL